MSGFFPVGTSLQLSDSSGNINFQGVLASNLNGTSNLSSSFPSSSTGTTTAHAHYTDISTNALKFLNASGTGVGGHQFWISNSTTAPKKTALIDISGLTIDSTASGGGGVVYSPNISALVDGSHIDFPAGTNLHNAPYNFNQTYNPIYLTQTNGFYTAGQLAYAFITNGGSQIQIFNNNSSTNPIPPNTVPSGFPNTDTTGLVIGQPIFSLTLPSPVVPITANLKENLTIINDTNTSILSASDLIFNNVSIKSQVSQNTLDISQNKTDISRNTINISKNTLDISQNTTDISRNTINISKNTLDISQNTTDISKNKVDISNNTNNINTLTIKQTNLIYQFSSPAIYADGQPPSQTPTSIINSYAINAWYFKNTVAGYKINWYMPTTSGLKVQDILGLYLRLFNVSTTSSDNLIYLTVYTTPDAGPNYSWYKSKMTYVVTATPTINTFYTFFANASGSCPNPSYYASTLLQMTPSTVQNPRGLYGPTETIMFFAIGSNSASAVNTVETVVQKFGVMTPSGTQEFAFAPLL